MLSVLMVRLGQDRAVPNGPSGRTSSSQGWTGADLLLGIARSTRRVWRSRTLRILLWLSWSNGAVSR